MGGGEPELPPKERLHSMHFAALPMLWFKMEYRISIEYALYIRRLYRFLFSFLVTYSDGQVIKMQQHDVERFKLP